jgi:LETM1 and EF-hand domain-containing protein 1, mitochondrial
MSLNRTARRVAPLLRHPVYSAHLRGSRFPTHIPAIAILVPRHSLSTETTTSGGSGSGPPPGFNLDKAKRPLPKDGADKGASKTDDKSASDEVSVARTGATAHPKTDALESQSLSELAAKKGTSKGELAAKKKEDDKKLTVWQKVKKEAAHYWDGTKLLATEVRISFKLALKMAAGYELTRREHRQVCTPET